MKNVWLFLGLLVVIVGVVFYYMPRRDYHLPASEESYPESLGSISCNELIAQSQNIPANLKKEVDAWVQKNKQLLDDILFLPHFPSMEALKVYTDKIKKEGEHTNRSKHNYIFDIGSEAVIKISGIANRISSMVSSMGYDPYKIKWWQRDDHISQVTSQEIPTQQHITRAATQLLLGQLQNENIASIPTYLYHIPGRPTNCDDRNYIIVQEKLSGFRSLASLSEEEKIDAIKRIDLENLYQALKKANLWNLSENNIWVNNNNNIAYPDGEKPNNEGYGRFARWNVAILGHDLEKDKFNIRNWFDGGHRAFENILRKYDPQRVEKWMQLYEQDQDAQQR